ncbi:hypothetical protein QBC41DRAFT_236581 [Cercophora samala]|uniref:C2H2-type domain-containing protein n=1 Tax=Cercophora samala TaxID=330535 RepID=A0AA39YXT2_9PEZI|nr:hypothetical protein QBC41DRAFT_236581 [Cercophora samala]
MDPPSPNPAPDDPLPVTMAPSHRNRPRVVLMDPGMDQKLRSESSPDSREDEDDAWHRRAACSGRTSQGGTYLEARHPQARYLDLQYRPLSFYGMPSRHHAWWPTPAQICARILVGRVDPTQHQHEERQSPSAVHSSSVQDERTPLRQRPNLLKDRARHEGLKTRRCLDTSSDPYQDNAFLRPLVEDVLRLNWTSCFPYGKRVTQPHHGGNESSRLPDLGLRHLCSPLPINAQQPQLQLQPTETKQSQRSKRASPAHGISTVSWVFTMSTNAYSPQPHSPCPPSEEQGEWVWVPKTTMPSPQAGQLDYQYTTTPIFTPAFDDSSVSPVTLSANHWESFMMTGQVDNTLFTSPSSSMINEFGTPFTGSPTDALLDDFLSDGYVGGSDLFSEVLPQQDFISADLLNTYVDGTLFPAVDLDLNLDTFVPDVATCFTTFGVAVSPASSLHESSPTFSYSPPIFDSPLPAATGASPDVTSPSTSQIHSCSESNCSKTFDKVSDLKRHERKHRQPFRCELCGKGHLDKRALGRHLWAKHPEYAQQHNTRSERIRCTECDYEGRADNVARHMKRHAKKR